jgi:hypothetical protein
MANILPFKKKLKHPLGYKQIADYKCVQCKHVMSAPFFIFHICPMCRCEMNFVPGSLRETPPARP